VASTDQIVEDLMLESGKSGHTARQRIELIVGEVILEVLGRNDGRFEGLRETIGYSVLKDVKHYKLPGNFNTPSKSFLQVNSDDEFIAECYIVQKMDVIRNLADSGYVGPRQAYIERLKAGPGGPGLYLVFGDELTETAYYQMDYYRKATTSDGDVVRKDGIVKDGARGKLPVYWPLPNDFAGMYAGQLRGFKESPRRMATTISFSPSRQTKRLNRKQHHIGGGG